MYPPMYPPMYPSMSPSTASPPPPRAPWWLRFASSGPYRALVTLADRELARRSDLIDKSVIRVFQTLREAKDLPVLEDAVAPELRPVLRMINAPSATGMPFIAPPDMPAERLAILRTAFMAMTRHPAFVEDANRIGEPADAPIDGPRLHALYAELIASATDATATAYKELTGQK